MAALVIKDLPAKLHRELKNAARRNRRSMTREAVVLLEQALRQAAPPAWPEPYKGRFPITDEWLRKAIREGRA